MLEYRGASDTRSGNERRFLALIREAGLPEPSVNAFVEGIVVDFFWPKHRAARKPNASANAKPPDRPRQDAEPEE
jgi:hypothetical protein